MVKLNLWLAKGKRRGTDPLHWILILAAENAETGTYYHVTGGPTQRTGYTLSIQSDKRFHSHGIGEHHFIGQIDERDRNRLKASTQKISPRRCQEWTVQVLRDLENKGLVSSGTGDYWNSKVEKSPYSTDGEHGIDNGGSSSRPTEARTSRSGGSSSASRSSGQASGGNPDWVWDEQRRRYRYWDARRRQWIFQS